MRRQENGILQTPWGKMRRARCSASSSFAPRRSPPVSLRLPLAEPITSQALHLSRPSLRLRRATTWRPILPATLAESHTEDYPLTPGQVNAKGDKTRWSPERRTRIEMGPSAGVTMETCKGCQWVELRGTSQGLSRLVKASSRLQFPYQSRTPQKSSLFQIIGSVSHFIQEKQINSVSSLRVSIGLWLLGRLRNHVFPVHQQ